MGIKRKLKQHRGYVRWFDNLTGTGVVTVPDLKEDFFVHWSADTRLDGYENKSLEYRKKRGGPFITYAGLDRVIVEIFFDSHFYQVSKITPNEWISRDDLISDKLLDFLEYNSPFSNREWEEWVLYNLICLCGD